MGVKLLEFPNKRIRAEAIREYMRGLGYDGAVCFSCGNATRELIAAGVDTVAISPEGDFMANRWFTQADVRRVFPTRFDATSGHLPLELLPIIGKRFREHLGELEGPVYVPTGSGETLAALMAAYPSVEFVAVRNLGPATAYEEGCPTNLIIRLSGVRVIDAATPQGRAELGLPCVSPHVDECELLQVW